MGLCSCGCWGEEGKAEEGGRHSTLRDHYHRLFIWSRGEGIGESPFTHLRPESRSAGEGWAHGGVGVGKPGIRSPL